MSKAALPLEVIFGGFEEAIGEMFLWYLLFLGLNCWLKLERLKREPTNVGSQEILLVLYLYIYYHFL